MSRIRPRRPHALGALICVLLVLLGLSTAAYGVARQQPKRENVRFEGELKAAQRGILQVVTAKGDQWFVKPPEKGDQVMYSAMAEPAWLRPGLIVRFLASLTNKGQATAPVREVTVFTPKPGVQMGVVRDSTDTRGIFEDVEKPEKPDPNAAAPYLVAGKLVSFKNGMMTVAWGGVSISAPLAEDAKVAVEVADFSLLREGDKVEVQGWYYQAFPNQAQATRLTITSPEPLEGARSKTWRAKSRKERSRKEG